jgi:D-alanyl-D-alanine carboxypeptidase/D-alanyl-D-alanine-endopeptidase (penicillin-binding protein 4)
MLLRYLILFFFQLSLLFVAAQQNELERAFQNFKDNTDLSSAHIGVQLLDSDGETKLVSYQKDKLFIPASITKLWTTAMATRMLKPKFKFKTVVGYHGELDSINHTLMGDLYVIMNGDPSLESRFIAQSFLKDLRQILINQKIKVIEGSIKIIPDDDSYHTCSQWLWSDLGNYYGAGYSSSTFMDNMVELYFNTNFSIGDTCEILNVIPTTASFLLTNEVTVGKQNRDLSYAFGAPMQNERVIKGNLPIRNLPYKVKVSMHNPQDFLYESIQKMMTALNIVELNHSFSLNTLTDTLLEYQSPELSELVKIVNFESNNNYAEHLMVECSKYYTNYLHIDTAATFMQSYWSGSFLNEVYFSDGSGLSRKNLVTPQAMNRLLAYILNDFNLNEKECLMNSLPVAGISGTLKYLGKKTKIEGNFIGKSGSMSGVRCYTGYFKKDEEYFPFTVMVNHFLVSDAKVRKAIEQLMEELYSAL